MINMGLYIVEKVVDGKTVDSHADTFEDYNDAVICMSELMQNREHEGETWHVRMLTEEEDEAMNMTYKRVDVEPTAPAKPEGVSGSTQAIEPMAAPIVKAIQSALGTEETGDALVEVARNAHKAEMELAFAAPPPVPDCDADKSAFLAVNHRLHAVFYLVCMLPGASRKELRKRLGVENIDAELSELVYLDVVRVTDKGNGKLRYSASAPHVSWLR